MEVIATGTPWIAEDDVLLKNAIEAGASLEALAKGAVRFSRKFTFKELRDRWQSLLYDPEVSSKASVDMIEFELSTSSHTSKLSKPAAINRSGENSMKRKTESIRRKYYAMRKRIRGQPFDDSVLDFFSGQRVNGHIDQGLYDCHLPVGQLAPQSYMLGAHIITNSGLPEKGNEALGFSEPAGEKIRTKADHVNMMFPKYDVVHTDAGNVCSEYGERHEHCFNSPLSESLAQQNSMGFSSPKEPLWKMTEDISPPVLPVTMSLQENTPNAEKRSNIPDGDHDCLLSSANEGNLLFMDVDGSTSMDKLCYDNLNSLLLSSPIYAHNESLPNDRTSKATDVAAALITSIAVPFTPTTVDVTADPSDRGLSTEKAENAPCLSVSVPSASSVKNTNCSEIQDITGPCVMNTEVEEVPDNDVIFSLGLLPAVHTLPQSTVEQRSLDGQKGKEQDLDLKIENAKAPGTAPGGSPMTPLKACSNHAMKSSIKAESPDAGTPVEKHAKSTQVIADRRKALIMSSKSGGVGKLGKASKAVLKESDVPDPKSGGLTSPEQIFEPKSPDAAESESDDDVPYFSDIEAMVLEMDLCASDHDPIGNSRVAQYQEEASKRQIIRLEQYARSSLDRHIESRGAFAILYGRRLRHYIKKPEVTLGRATEDMDVDIDLAREGRANKISRRQASIKLEADGSFVMKNLGKFSISVNGTELVTGQCIILTSSNLIEIRGMSFIFEANHRCVNRHLASIKQASQSLALQSK